ncbi:radical SAM family heme chaperone HemW [Mollicutes bacterium LVI A0039]|nr:radical SAM family heme chaperone HemW [Mollicutes bacterium LVI A0039]
MNKGLYIHIPFCKYICSYCDFGKKYIQNQPVDEYIDALAKEIDMYAPFLDVNTIYIGGGTPSSLNQKQLTKLFDKLKQHLDLTTIAEFSFELNPDDVTAEFLDFLKSNHVNRLSIGAQTLNDEILTSLKRKHSAADVRTAVETAQHRFDNVSVDFMFNLPNQTRADVEQTLDFIDQYNLDHVSYYGLIFEEHTILSQANHEYWTEDYESEMYNYIQRRLEQSGFSQYEISNYAKPGKQSLHNIHYWTRNEYYGVGLSSSGFLADQRYTNTYSLRGYIDTINGGNLPVKTTERLTEADVAFEAIMLGMRYYQYIEVANELLEYVKKSEFLNDKFDYNQNQIRLKPQFYYISNQIILELLERIEC